VAGAVAGRQVLDDQPRPERELARDDVAAQLVLDAVVGIRADGFDRFAPEVAEMRLAEQQAGARLRLRAY